MKLIDYVTGNRRGREARRIERDAMEDPFLRDALDGFDAVEGDHAGRIDRLHGRIAGAPKKISGVFYRAIAAVLLLCAALGGYRLIRRGTERFSQEKFAEATEPVRGSQPERTGSDSQRLAMGAGFGLEEKNGGEESYRKRKMDGHSSAGYRKERDETRNAAGATEMPVVGEKKEERDRIVLADEARRVGSAPAETAVEEESCDAERYAEDLSSGKKTEKAESGSSATRTIADKEERIAEMAADTGLFGTVTVRNRKYAASVPGRFSGRVTDSQGNPLSGAEIRFRRETLAMTDSCGRFVLTGLSERDTLRIVRAGYRTEAVPVGRNVPLTVVLQRTEADSVGTADGFEMDSP